jgi:hypothetical protein
MEKSVTSIKQYLSEIGRRGGQKSRRRLSSEDACNMVRVREARKAFYRFHAQCFWYMPQDLDITLADVPDIVRGLRKNGGREGYLLAMKLCR